MGGWKWGSPTATGFVSEICTVHVKVLGTCTSGTGKAIRSFPPVSGKVLILPCRVIDGDSFAFYYLIEGRGRLAGIDAPERGTLNGAAAKAFLASILPDYPTEANLLGKEKFGRVLVMLADERGRDVGEQLIARGLAKPWDGKGPKP